MCDVHSPNSWENIKKSDNRTHNVDVEDLKIVFVVAEDELKRVVEGFPDVTGTTSVLLVVMDPTDSDVTRLNMLLVPNCVPSLLLHGCQKYLYSNMTYNAAAV